MRYFELENSIHKGVNENEMNKCKFCDGEAEVIANGYGRGGSYSIRCKKCGMRLYLPWCSDHTTAKNMWNDLTGKENENENNK